MTIKGPQLAGELNAVALGADGRYYTSQFRRPAPIMVFGPDGRFQGTVGGRGQGPGEFAKVDAIGIRNDTVVAIDTRNARLSLFTTSGSFLGSVHTPLPYAREMLLRGHSVLVSGTMPSPSLSGLPLHEVDIATGRILHSFGDLNPVVNPLYPWLNARTFTAGGGGSVWSARQTAYELERWNQEGQRTDVVYRDAEWFQPYVERPVGSAERPPPWVSGVTEVSRGRLLVAVSRAAADFTSRLGPKQLIAGGYYYDVGRRTLLYDTILEVIDVENGVVVARTTVEQCVMGFIRGTTLAYTYNEDGGVPEVEVLRVAFTSGGRRE